MTASKAVFTESAYPNGQDMTQRRFIFAGTLAIGASPATYPAGGMPITFAAPNLSPGTTRNGAVRGEVYSRSGSGYTYFWTTTDLWTSLYKGNSVALGQSLQDTNGNIQTCTTAGTSGSGAEPTWAVPTAATPNPTTTDGTTVWTCEGPSSGLVQIFEQNGTTGPLVELAQAASIPSGVSGDKISVRLEFIKG
jgi:hypothetical protein